MEWVEAWLGGEEVDSLAETLVVKGEKVVGGGCEIKKLFLNE